MKTTAAILLLLVFLASPLIATASPAPAPSLSIDFLAIDQFITAQMDKHGLKGISLAITQGEEIVYLKGYGTAGGGRPMTAQTPMYIGSQSKSFTGLAIAQLAEEGKINLKSPVQTYLPWFKIADPKASQRITVDHLLHHTSGLSESGFAVTLPEDSSGEDAVRALASAQITAPVGTQHQYFNFGYIVLAVIIETVSGQPYEEYVRENIFGPLGMTLTTTDPAIARTNGLSQGYSRFFGFTVPRRQPHRVYENSDGFIISTAEDMARYAIAMNNKGAYEGSRVLSAEWMLKLFTPVQGYGMGWFVQPDHINHGGANETFKTYVDLYPREELGIVLLINQGSLMDHFISAEQVFNGVSSIALGNEVPQVSAGWSVRWIGWALLALVLALIVIHTRSFLALRNWKVNARGWSTGKLAWDVALNFLVPTIILILVFSQMKGFFGYRFNLIYMMSNLFTWLPDIGILMVLGSLPDYLQGFIKLFWILTGKTSKDQISASVGAEYSPL